MPSCPCERLDLVAHALADAGVEVGERLVEQQDAGIDRERAAERHPLALAAGELGHRPLAEPVEAEQRQHLADPRARARPAATPRSRRP